MLIPGKNMEKAVETAKILADITSQPVSIFIDAAGKLRVETGVMPQATIPVAGYTQIVLPLKWA